MKTPLISIVIPTYNEENDISNCIKSLLNQDYKKIEIIIVDDGSTDNTRKIIKSFKKVRLIEGEHKGPGFSRNLGARKAKGKILVFVDADMTFPKNYIRELTKPIINEETIGTEEKKQYATNMDNIWSKCWGTYSKENLPNLGNIFRAILKSKFIELGGFDSRYGYADDMTFYFKYQLQSKVVERAFCYHKNPETLREIYKQSRWIGASLNNQFKIFDVPILSHLLLIILIPLSVLIIPLMSIKRAFERNQFGMIFFYLIFFSVRYYGSLVGLFRKIYKGYNLR